jgi:hypothetical protein
LDLEDLIEGHVGVRDLQISNFFLTSSLLLEAYITPISSIQSVRAATDLEAFCCLCSIDRPTNVNCGAFGMLDSFCNQPRSCILGEPSVIMVGSTSGAGEYSWG